MVIVNNKKYDFVTNSKLAKKAYEQAESVIRQVETNGSWNMEQEDYGNIDWILVGLAMSMLCVNRKQQFFNVLNKQLSEGENEQELAYNIVLTNYFYDNYTMYILECFRQLFVKKYFNAKVLKQNFDEFINGCYVKTEGKQKFKFFTHTPNPIVVQ